MTLLEILATIAIVVFALSCGSSSSSPEEPRSLDEDNVFDKDID